ncbi:MAG: hypothetical protein J7501_00880 [Bdellovibrio sp.]|nr:hypothetical protein [Bdellovibrio sp.]
MRHVIIIVVSLLFVNIAAAKPVIEELEKFERDRWSEGLHLLVGGGANFGVYVSDAIHQDIGMGPVLKTEVGYFFNDRLAVEWSALIKFNFVDSWQVWDTLFSLGVRYRFEDFGGLHGPFMRAFVGSVVNVLYFRGDPPPGYADFSRVQFEGPMVGVGFGSMEETEKGTVWYWEITATGEALERSTGINMSADVPVTDGQSSVDDHSQLYSVYFTMGIVAF